MRLSEIIVTQAKEIAIMWAAGMTIGLLRDILSLFQRARKPIALLSFLQDILFWVLAALLASYFLYYCSFGQVSFHSMAALVIGWVTWRSCFVIKKSQSSAPFCDIIISTAELRRCRKEETIEKRHTVFRQKGAGECRHEKEEKKPRFQRKSAID